ncbi:MAG: restriction endonuclease subunit S [Gloeocapsa sp. UFS-A4-WI-NPMV-4B04]|jgi:type I restriction enzyme S subunit|nr:restriction endonuclease subunit S [Gloeocapsa sp. UFS-A4-WI-NPMV-4B04]
MKTTWIKATLEDVCVRITDGAHHSPKSIEYGFPMASVKDLTPHGITLETCRHISKEDFENLTRQGCQPEIGDVLIAKDGNSALETVCEIKHKLDVVLLSSVAILRPNNNKINSSFLRYFLDCKNTRQYLKNGFITGAAIPRVILKDFKRCEIYFPPLPTQRKIAAILSAYDRLIENNTQRIKILEEMARSLYREWFVNFRFPGHEQVKMVDSELGLIPEGWGVTTVEKIGAPGKSIVSGPFGSNIGKRFFVKDGVPVIRGNNLSLGIKKFIDEGFVFITEEKAYELRNCEALPNDIIFTAAGTLGQVGLIPRNPKYSKYIISNKQLRLRTNKDILLPEYLYYWFSRPEMINHIINQNKGASVPLITLGILRSFSLLLPPIFLQRKFTNFAVSNSNLIEKLEHKNNSLRRTRDLLLPKLILGEIDVENLDINTGGIAA